MPSAKTARCCSALPLSTLSIAKTPATGLLLVWARPEQYCTFCSDIPGSGRLAPNRYTTIRPRVNSSFLRRSAVVTTRANVCASRVASLGRGPRALTGALRFVPRPLNAAAPSTVPHRRHGKGQDHEEACRVQPCLPRRGDRLAAGLGVPLPGRRAHTLRDRAAGRGRCPAARPPDLRRPVSRLYGHGLEPVRRPDELHPQVRRVQ